MVELAPLKRIDGKPLYVCDIEKLNCFADKEFDFVYCSHVLEHVRSPERACSELSRIGKRGYIETPTRGKDLWLNTAKISNHLWSVESYQSKFVFTEYTPEETEGLQNDLLMKMHVRPETPREKALTSLLYLKADLVNTMLLWEEKLECEVRRSSAFGSPIDTASKLKPTHSRPAKSSSTQQLKIYADRDYLPAGTKHTPLLVPLWGDIDSEGDPDWLRFKNYHSAGQEYFVQSDVTEADIVILPGDWTHCRQEGHRLMSWLDPPSHMSSSLLTTLKNRLVSIIALCFGHLADAPNRDPMSLECRHGALISKITISVAGSRSARKVQNPSLASVDSFLRLTQTFEESQSTR